MKKITSALIFLMLSISMFSQQTKEPSAVVIYKCTLTAMINKAEAMKYKDNAAQLEALIQQSMIESDFLIKLDVNASSLVYDNKIQSKYFIRYMEKEEKLLDASYDTYTQTQFKAYDEEGLPCTFYIKKYENINVIIFTAEYLDVILMWQAMRLN